MAFLAGLALATWFQFFAANRFRPYMAADMALVVFGLSAFGVARVIEARSLTRGTALMVTISLLWLAWNLFEILHLPWVHPLLHKAAA